MDEITKTARVIGLPVILIYFGYLMYDKNFYLSVGLICFGLLLGCYGFYTEFKLRKEKQDYDLDKHGTRRRSF